MLVHVDLTNSPHVTLFAPMVRELEAAGHTVLVTARRFAQTIELCELHGLQATVIGTHGGASRLGKARAAAARTWRLLGFLKRAQRAAGETIAVSLSHGSTDAPQAARRLGIPHVTMFDYEWAATMHRLNCRASWRVLVPDAIPASRLWQYGVAGKLRTYPGLKESYALDPDRLDPDAVRQVLGVEAATPLVVLRPPPELALYHRGRSDEPFARALDELLGQNTATVVALPRTGSQRAELARIALEHPRLIVPQDALDGPSLVAAAALVISAGGTMNREAAALGVPVLTALQAEPAAIDEALERDGILRRIEDADLARVDWTDVPASLGFSGATVRDRWRIRPMRDLVELALDGLPDDRWQGLPGPRPAGAEASSAAAAASRARGHL